MNRYLRNILGKYTKIIVWGTGNFYKMYKNLLDERVVYFVDNNVQKCGHTLDRKNIFHPEKLKDEEMNGTLVVVCNNYFEEISVQIKQYGDFDIIDILTIELVLQKEKKLSMVKQDEMNCYIAVCGGIHAMWQTNGSRKFINGQLEVLHKVGFCTLEIIPLLYFLAGKRESSFFSISIDGVYKGIFSIKELVQMYPKVRGMVIHSLYYSYATIKTLLESIEVETRILYYIHDYSCLCVQRFLYKDKNLCIDANGDIDCSSCDVEREQKKLLHFYQAIFKQYKVLLVAPSTDTKERVESFYKDIEIVELPHLVFETEYFKKKVNSRIKIAYIGTAIWHKGWWQYIRLVNRFHQKYDFYCLGDCPDDMKVQNITYIQVGLKESEQTPTMTDALLQYGIDIAYIGSVWPETYSFTYYEAYAAGCFVLTNTQSGNVCKQVSVNQNGISFSNESEMVSWLEKDTVEKEVLNVNKRIKNIHNSTEVLKYFE